MVYAIDSENRNATFFGRCSCHRISAKKRPFSCIFMDFHDFQFVNMKDFMFFHGFSRVFRVFWGPPTINHPMGCSAHRIAQCRLRDNQYPPEHQVAQAMGPKICGRWLELSVKNCQCTTAQVYFSRSVPYILTS